MDKELGSDIVSALGKRVAQQAKDHTSRVKINQELTDLFSRSRTRILDHSLSARRTATLFRFIGLILAVSGIAIAAYNLYLFFTDDGLLRASSAGGSGNAGQNYLSMIRHLPFTLPFIILAEVLALIMFRYHSKALEMMRYFSNEATTLSLRQAGALLVVEHGSKGSLLDLSTELLRSERNIIMRKDEKTIELAQNRDEDALLKSILEKAESVWKRKQNAKDEAPT